MEQVKNVCDMVETIYAPTTHRRVFIFDQSCCHRRFSDYAVQAKKVLVKDCGERRVRDVTWAGRPQPMVHSDGTAKGLRTVLQERGINASTLKVDDMRTILSNHDDF